MKRLESVTSGPVWHKAVSRSVLMLGLREA